jgi:hypothetical protein
MYATSLSNISMKTNKKGRIKIIKYIHVQYFGMHGKTHQCKQRKQRLLNVHSFVEYCKFMVIFSFLWIVVSIFQATEQFHILKKKVLSDDCGVTRLWIRLACCLNQYHWVTIATSCDAVSSRNRQDLIQSLVPTHYVCNKFI